MISKSLQYNCGLKKILNYWYCFRPFFTFSSWALAHMHPSFGDIGIDPKHNLKSDIFKYLRKLNNQITVILHIFKVDWEVSMCNYILIYEKIDKNISYIMLISFLLKYKYSLLSWLKATLHEMRLSIK